MKRLPLCLLLVLALSPIASAINLNPATSQRLLCGIRFPQLVFEGKERQFTYEKPRGWSHVFDGEKLLVSTPAFPQAQGSIRKAAVHPEVLDEKAIATLEKQVVASLPEGSKPEFILAEVNPLRIDGRETIEILFTFSVGPQELQSGVVFCNLGETQLQFRCTAPKADFETVYGAFRASIFSWQGRDRQSLAAQ